MITVGFDRTGKLILLDVGVVSADEAWTFYVPVALDTGATVTVLPADILRDLGYDPAHPKLPRMRIITGSGVEYAPCVPVKRLIVGGEEIKQLDVLCHDLPAEAGVDGLLGLNVLKNFDFTVEYSSGRIHFKRI